ncbi:MAG: DUF4921 family protein [Candidatus Sungbacteria bacterium]|nr:DUF4921 family protein [Candidatus Sungbacteria bacterium]
MKKKVSNGVKGVSELRQDLVTGDWVVIATGRAKRPGDFLKQKRAPFTQPKATCPFEKLLPKALAVYAADGQHREKDWWVQAVSNKYPAFNKGICAVVNNVGPYQWAEGAGFHEVVITREHDRPFARMTREEVSLVLRVYQERFCAMEADGCVKYISIFHNHGRLSGASIAHPHSQIIAIPVVPPDVVTSLRGATEYFKKEHACAHCVIIKYELQKRQRIVYENKNFIALAPYASRTAFEMRIFPKAHRAHFEQITSDERDGLADTLRATLCKLAKGLGNPDYNFFIHTAPTKDHDAFALYHWHIEILPKTAIWAGFEIGTGIEISTIAPETAAAFLQKVKV